MCCETCDHEGGRPKKLWPVLSPPSCNFFAKLFAVEASSSVGRGLLDGCWHCTDCSISDLAGSLLKFDAFDH